MAKIVSDPACRLYVQSTQFVNVADSSPKLTIEPRMIADSVVRALETALAAHRDAVAGGPALVLGYGAIGRTVANALVDHFELSRPTIHVHDPLTAAQAAAQHEGFGFWNRAGPPFTQY